MTNASNAARARPVTQAPSFDSVPSLTVRPSSRKATISARLASEAWKRSISRL